MTPRKFVIAIYEKNGKLFAANNVEQLQRDYPAFYNYFRIIHVEERKAKNPKRPKAAREVQASARERAKED